MRLDDCSYQVDYDNPINLIAGVACVRNQSLINVTSFALLVNESKIVMANSKGYLGPVCKDQWSLNETQVFCKQLGYFDTDQAKILQRDEEILQPFAISSIECSGSESSLQDCKVAEGKTCFENQAVHVSCNKIL